MIKELLKGQMTPLPYTSEGRGRVTVGISWDTPEVIPETAEAFRPEDDEGIDPYGQELEIEVGYVTETFDLDLVCLIFNANKEIIDAVSPAPKENVDLSGAIYHSGDDTRGVSGGDDEQISLELSMVPDDHAYYVFIAIIQNKKRTFKHVLNTTCRIGDGKTDSTMWSLLLAGGEELNADKTASIMTIFAKDNTGKWWIKNVSEYFIDKEIEDWAATAQKFL